MTATLDHQIAALQRANAELQARLDARTTERDEAEAQKVALAEVLEIINSSSGDLSCVFDAILEKAHRLCGIAHGSLQLYAGGQLRAVATRGVPEPLASRLRQPHPPGPDAARLLAGSRFHQLTEPAESAQQDASPNRQGAVWAAHGIHTRLFVPLRRDEAFLGMIVAGRTEVRPFTEKEIALLRNFAAQAMIAMENARLLDELRDRTANLEESLEYQTATSDVLKVISRSTFDLQPVLTSAAETAGRLCNADLAFIVTRDGEAYRPAASYSLSPEWEAHVWTQSFTASRETVIGRVLLEAQPVLVADLAADSEHTRPSAVTIGKVRTALGVPLLRQGKPIGVIAIGRQRVEPFTERQIDLVRTFADQAVIAIENARLITETREALEQQTATAEVLGVINSSPGDLAPVFDAMLEKALRLCDAKFGNIATYDGGHFHFVAALGHPEFDAWARQHGPGEPRPGTTMERTIRGENVIHIPDMADDEGYRSGTPVRHALVEVGGFRTLLCVALRKDDRLLGMFHIYRQEVRPFSDKQIVLLQNFAAQAVIAMENARLIIETQEALDQQTANAEVLQVINTSLGDLAPVFDTILDKALRLCGAAFGMMNTYDGERFQTAAVHNFPPALAEMFWHDPPPPGPHSPPTLMAQGKDVVTIDDLTVGPGADLPRRRALIEQGGARTYVAVALRKDGRLLGTLGAYRQEQRPFADKEIGLLQNFAAQAVIAMENARLITETREALEQQTATAEVLGVINSSPGNLVPVFDAILEKAHALCGIALGELELYEDGKVRAVAIRGVSGLFAELLREPFAPPPGSPPARLIAGETTVQIDDVLELARHQPNDPRAVAGAQHELRTALFVPLRKDDALLGYITGYRREVRPFSDKEIALLQNFAAQAVIAIENTRLITETREALEQQTATAEVLQVINSSPGELAPVFKAMLEKALRLCGAAFGMMNTYDGERFLRAADYGVPPAYAEFRRHNQQAFAPDTAPGRILAGEDVVHNIDLKNEHAYERGDPNRRALVLLGGARSHLAVALRKDSRLLGHIGIYRQEVRPFTDKQIALLQNFAAQAVIAMENARLITETREALAQQTATAQVLGVINASPGDLAPVFDAILEKALSLCDAAFGSLARFDGDAFDWVATRGVPEAWFAEFKTSGYRPTPGLALHRFQHGDDDIEHVADIAADESGRSAIADRHRFAELTGARTAIWIALRKDRALRGAVVIYRREVRPFTDKQIALLQNFAAQAVIAMENARLLTETREALEQQTATAEVLGVINSSPGDLAPVFDAMLEKATRLCGAAAGTFWLRAGEDWSAVAVRGMPEQFVKSAHAYRPTANSPVGRISGGERLVHLHDLAAEEVYRAGDALIRAAVDRDGVRTLLSVPLRREDEVLGVFSVYRREVRPFTDQQIALMQNFAAQAVIAMENARLINETREALDQQTATAEVLGVINSSPGNLAPVFDAMLERAVRLSEAVFGIMNVHDGQHYRAVSLHGVPHGFRELWMAAPPLPGPRNALSRMVGGEDVVHIEDLASYESYVTGDPRTRLLVEIGGARSLLAVALRKDGALLGSLTAYRQEVRPFTDKQIALLQSFASQAVIAMENARLLDEIRQRQAELRVTFDNMADGVVMFDEDLRLAAWNRNFQELLDLPNTVLAERPTYADYLRILAERGEFGTDDIEAELSRRLAETNRELRLERTRPDGRIVEVRRNSVPDGGFVLIYSDITERKRSEAEIRAARDAAEAAYADLKAAQSSLIQAQKMAALGQLTAGIAHEIKNPLNFVNNFAGLSVELLDELKETAAPALDTLDEDKRSDVDETIELLSGNLEKIAEHGRRADNIVKSMLEHSRGVSGERREVDLNGLIEEALNLAYHGARAQDQSFNITMERDFDRELRPTEVAPQEITRVFLNLFGNGFYAANKRSQENSGGSFRPALTVSTRDLGDAVEVKVRDNGTGIPPEIKDKLFQPFFTTKPTGEGTGLGLSISYDIVTQQHGGTIEVDSEVGAFTEFTVRLPRTQTTGRVAA